MAGKGEWLAASRVGFRRCRAERSSRAEDGVRCRTLRAFETESALTIDDTETHWILQWALSEGGNYSRFDEEDGRGWMGRLAPLRDNLLRGDLRLLYLGWLAGCAPAKSMTTPLSPRRHPVCPD